MSQNNTHRPRQVKAKMSFKSGPCTNNPSNYVSSMPGKGFEVVVPKVEMMNIMQVSLDNSLDNLESFRRGPRVHPYLKNAEPAKLLPPIKNKTPLS